MKPIPLLAIAIFACFLTTAKAAGPESSALPPDAELKKWIVGSWRVDYPSSQSTSHYGYEAYHENGTFKHVGEVQEGSARAKLLIDLSGTWSVEGGYLLKRVTAANLSSAIGRVYRDKIESANHDWFSVRERSGSWTRRRAQLPPELAPGHTEAPKVYTVEEAARVLRFAVKPEYSYEARRARITGGGIFELCFDYETGRLKAIDIVQSTGSRILDHDAVAGLKEWRAKPHTIRVMRIPITFVMG